MHFDIAVHNKIRTSLTYLSYDFCYNWNDVTNFRQVKHKHMRTQTTLSSFGHWLSVTVVSWVSHTGWQLSHSQCAWPAYESPSSSSSFSAPPWPRFGLWPWTGRSDLLGFAIWKIVELAHLSFSTILLQASTHSSTRCSWQISYLFYCTFHNSHRHKIW